jgi:hypothetical protein
MIFGIYGVKTMSDFITKESGKREEFETGAIRDTRDSKPRYDLISAHGLRRLAELMARGAEKYGDRNWELGMSTSRMYESAMRHLMEYRYDASEDHLSAVVFNLFAIMHYQEEIAAGNLPSYLDDVKRFKNL